MLASMLHDREMAKIVCQKLGLLKAKNNEAEADARNAGEQEQEFDEEWPGQWRARHVLETSCICLWTVCAPVAKLTIRLDAYLMYVTVP